MAHFEIKRAASGDYYFHLRASGNNKIILSSGQYKTKDHCEKGIEAVKAQAPYDSRYERLYSVNKQYYFNLKSTNGAVTGVSETYMSIANREHGIDLVKEQAATAPVVDIS